MKLFLKILSQNDFVFRMLSLTLQIYTKSEQFGSFITRMGTGLAFPSPSVKSKQHMLNELNFA